MGKITIENDHFETLHHMDRLTMNDLVLDVIVCDCEVIEGTFCRMWKFDWKTETLNYKAVFVIR